jgi:TPR repeat protein
VLVVASGTRAAPADDYQLGLQAYNRGDVVGAMSALRAPAKAGHGPSQSLLAFILDKADFVEEAFALYRDAAAQGEPEAHAALAVAYLSGRGVTKDEKLALQHFSKAADLGHAKSIEVVADAYVKGSLGTAASSGPEAAAAVQRAAERGHLSSMDALAKAYQSGRWQLPVDPQQAAQWTTKAGELRAKLSKPASAPRRGSR